MVHSLIGLLAEGYAPDDTTAAMAYLISTQQTADGSFRTLPARPPIESSVFSSTALSIRALQAYGKDPESQIRKATEWLRTATPGTTDGGWAPLPALGSDAYATGQVLVALQASGQVDVSDPVYQRGVAFLLRTQEADGSWLVRTRSFPLQPYKESGFPHGKNQWISAAGTSWAVMALSLTTLRPQQLSNVF